METFHYLIGEQTPHIAWWQMCVRAVIIFVYAVVLYRVAPRRSFGAFAMPDIVFTVIAGSSLSRALTGNAPLLPTLAATALLVVLYALLLAGATRSEAISGLFKGRSVRLIDGGRVDWAAARRSNLGARDLDEQLRMHGVRGPDEIDEARLERSGEISVIRRDRRPG